MGVPTGAWLEAKQSQSEEWQFWDRIINNNLVVINNDLNNCRFPTFRLWAGSSNTLSHNGAWGKGEMGNIILSLLKLLVFCSLSIFYIFFKTCYLFIIYHTYWVFVPPYLGLLWRVPHSPLLRPSLKPRNNVPWTGKRGRAKPLDWSLMLGVLKFPNRWDENNQILVGDERQPKSFVDHYYCILQMRNRDSVHVIDMPKRTDLESAKWELDSIPGQLCSLCCKRLPTHCAPHKND